MFLNVPHVTGTHTCINLSYISIGLRRSKMNHCMYIGAIASHTVIVAVFCITDMGSASKFLNIRITQEPGVSEIDQGPYDLQWLSAYHVTKPKSHI